MQIMKMNLKTTVWPLSVRPGGLTRPKSSHSPTDLMATLSCPTHGHVFVSYILKRFVLFFELAESKNLQIKHDEVIAQPM